jgi:hypothetical protein
VIADRRVVRHLRAQVLCDREEPLPVGLVGAVRHHVAADRDEIEALVEHPFDEPAMRRVTAAHVAVDSDPDHGAVLRHRVEAVAR